MTADFNLNKEEIDVFLESPHLEAFHEIATKRPPLTEQALFEILCDEVALMIETRMDYLLGLMYRLDVEEYKINAVLTPGYPDAPNVGLARLILERQKQRLWTKRNFKTPPIEDQDWVW